MYENNSDPIILCNVTVIVVSGVFFRRYTCNEATRLHLFGWCRNTRSDTVEGVMQGEYDAIEQM